MNNEFFRPVFTGEQITCELIIEHIEQGDGVKKVEMSTVYRNQENEEVMSGSSYGTIKDR
ncbi:hypothetical protein GCM10010954_25330 [Halobacillus andaensis]|uniref:N-terminal of MaoC-like dehydratase domain-containing protein n=1 Tax=Halobacillus andaensis TaxID=1176239 RepID=A0A917EX96_HALAA|nr:acyl dehydratase [Halobacillus andaensis]GGF25375.1 hypothetical protein GCM10010954_25330 [Halobacillus andaensis]